MVKSYSISSLILFCITLAETAILSNITVLPAVPDLILITVMFFSLLNGKLYGETTGFISGLFLDFLSGSPFGFNCLFRTFMGYLTGSLHGLVNYNGILIPMLLGAVGTVLKAFLIWLVSLFFPNYIMTYTLISIPFLFELIANTLLTPIMFKFLNVFTRMISSESEEII